MWGLSASVFVTPALTSPVVSGLFSPWAFPGSSGCNWLLLLQLYLLCVTFSVSPSLVGRVTTSVCLHSSKSLLSSLLLYFLYCSFLSLSVYAFKKKNCFRHCISVGFREGIKIMCSILHALLTCVLFLKGILGIF